MVTTFAILCLMIHSSQIIKLKLVFLIICTKCIAFPFENQNKKTHKLSKYVCVFLRACHIYKQVDRVVLFGIFLQTILDKHTSICTAETKFLFKKN